MKIAAVFKNKLSGLLEAVNRYPLTMLFLVAIATLNGSAIHYEAERMSPFLFTFIVGALLSVVAQQLYERFFTKPNERFLLMGGAIVFAIVYHLLIASSSGADIENYIKTSVLVFAFVLVFIWIPSMKSELTFNESFVSAFKAFFITVLFTAVIAGGVSLIFSAIDMLLVSVKYKLYLHAFNLIVSLFSPIFFLSFTPLYLGKKDDQLANEQLAERKEQIEKAIRCPKNLSILISYIIIPLTVVYTVILVIYVLLNIGGQFWTENLLEPLLVSYAVTIIFVYILASHLNNSFANLFRKLFPKILIPIVLFQTLASFLKIGDMGLTHSRYYVILFGLFALVASVIFSFLPPRKNGLIAGVFIVFSAVSIVPPIDAFTVSKHNQIDLLERVLLENDMLQNGEIIPNSTLSTEDKRTITRTVQYLERMEYNKEIAWLPERVVYSSRFEETFGFAETYGDGRDGNNSKYAYLNVEKNPLINIAEFDFFSQLHVNEAQEKLEVSFEKDGETYVLTNQLVGDDAIRIVDEHNETLIEFYTEKLPEKIFSTSGSEGKRALTIDEATVSEENDRVKLSLIVQSISEYGDYYYADIYLLIKIK